MTGGAVLWVDAQLPPALAAWIEDSLGIPARSVARLGLRDATDEAIFAAARTAGATVLTKDADFPHLLAIHGPPPQVVWLTLGNTTNANARDVLGRMLPVALALLAAGEALVEIAGR